jgi:hypothetical protein
VADTLMRFAATIVLVLGRVPEVEAQPAVELVGATYACRATAVSELMDDGSLQRLDRFMSGWDSPFQVDRATGLVAGGPADNATDPVAEVVFTPPDNLFHVISKSGGQTRSVTLLSVRDSAPGPRKPFLLVNSSWVFSGVCESGG